MKAKLLQFNGNFILECPYEARDTVKSIYDFYKWNKKFKMWEIPTTLEALAITKEFFEVEMSQGGWQLFERLMQEETNYEYIKKIQHDLNWTSSNHQHLFRHQKICLEAAKLFPTLALFLEPGLGKTLTSIEIANYYGGKNLAVCPKSIINSAWLNDIKKWSDMKAVSLWGKSKKKRLWLLETYSHYDFFIINYDGLKMLKKELIDFGFNTIFVDESSKMKSPKSQITKTFHEFAKKIPHRYILSGTPAPNTLLDYWGQMNFIDHNILGPNYYRFRGKFFESDYMGYKWNVSEENKQKIINKISRRAIFFSKDDCLDLPDKTFEIREIEMDTNQLTVYKDMKKNLLAEFEGKVKLAQNEISKIMALRQITSGFMYTKDKGFVDISESKFNELLTVLEEIGNKQVIVWIQFIYEGEKLLKFFGNKAYRLFGNMKYEDQNKSISDFKNGNKQYLIANPQSAGHGLTFVNSSYAIYYSLNYSYEQFVQSQDRQHRIGQKNVVTYFLLLCKNSIDEVLYKVLTQKGNLSEECLNILK